MKKLRCLNRISIALLSTSLIVTAVATVHADEGGSSEATDAQQKGRGNSSRLKFRNGPICMCVNGIGEEEIRNAEKKRQSGERYQKNSNNDSKNNQ